MTAEEKARTYACAEERMCGVDGRVVQLCGRGAASRVVEDGREGTDVCVQGSDRLCGCEGRSSVAVRGKTESRVRRVHEVNGIMWEGGRPVAV